MIIEFEGYQLIEADERGSVGNNCCSYDVGLLVYGKTRSKEEVARMIHQMVEKFPLLTSREVVERFMLMYGYQLVPENYVNPEADLLVDMDTYLVFKQNKDWDDSDERVN